MNTLEQLANLLRSLPGIGPRQAKRIALSLAQSSKEIKQSWLSSFQSLISSLSTCSSCLRVIENNTDKLCHICRDGHRNNAIRLLVSHDTDIEACERSGSFNGLYLVVGGPVPVTKQTLAPEVKVSELEEIIKTRKPTEIILGLGSTPDAIHTEELLATHLTSFPVKVTRLAKGMAYGSSLEYIDPATFEEAINRRT